MRMLRFDTTLTSRFQELRGDLLLQLDGREIAGSLTIGKQQSFLQGKMLRKNRYVASLRLKTETYQEDCDIVLRVRENGYVRGYIMGEWDGWTLEGDAAEVPPARAFSPGMPAEEINQ